MVSLLVVCAALPLCASSATVEGSGSTPLNGLTVCGCSATCASPTVGWLSGSDMNPFSYIYIPEPKILCHCRAKMAQVNVRTQKTVLLSFIQNPGTSDDDTNALYLEDGRLMGSKGIFEGLAGGEKALINVAIDTASKTFVAEAQGTSINATFEEGTFLFNNSNGFGICGKGTIHTATGTLTGYITAAQYQSRSKTTDTDSVLYIVGYTGNSKFKGVEFKCGSHTHLGDTMTKLILCHFLIQLIVDDQGNKKALQFISGKPANVSHHVTIRAPLPTDHHHHHHHHPTPTWTGEIEVPFGDMYNALDEVSTRPPRFYKSLVLRRLVE